MKFDLNKHGIEQFQYDLKVLGKMIRMSHKQILDHFKGVFQPKKIDVQLLEIADTDVAIWKAKVLVFKSKVSQSRSSSMLAHMTDRNEDTEYIEQRT